MRQCRAAAGGSHAQGAQDTIIDDRRRRHDQIGAILLHVNGRPFVLGPFAPKRIDRPSVEPLPAIKGRKPLPLQVRRQGDENGEVQHVPHARVRGKAAVEQNDRSARGFVGHHLARPARCDIITGRADAHSRTQRGNHARQHIDTISRLGRGVRCALGRGYDPPSSRT